MKGYFLKYRAFDNGTRTLLNHTLFGRLMKTKNKRRGIKIAYYRKGMLDKIPYKKIKNGLIFLKSLQGIYLEELRVLGDVSIYDGELDVSDIDFITGREYWYKNAVKNDYIFKKPKR